MNLAVAGTRACLHLRKSILGMIEGCAVSGTFVEGRLLEDGEFPERADPGLQDEEFED